MYENAKNFYRYFIREEIEYYLREANFDDRERELFILRSKNISVEQSAEIMNCSISTINRINRNIRNKIAKSSINYYSGISKTWK